MASDVERLRYYERQFLGAIDFTDEQDYHRDSLRRHLVGPHTWGIVTGLGLSTTPDSSGTGIDITIECGLAVDAFGRPIVVLDQVALPKGQFDALPYQAPAQWVDVGLRYAETMTDAPAPGFQSCAAGGDDARIVETYTIVVNPPGQAGYANGDVTVAGQAVDPATAVADYSIPYQELPDDATGLWTVPLGRVQYQASADPTVAGTFLAADGGNRVYSGVVAASVLAPAGGILVKDRGDQPAPTPAPPLLSVDGTLDVSGLVTAAAGLDVTGTVDVTGPVNVTGQVDITGGLQVGLDSTTQAVFGTATAGGTVTPQVTITDDGTVTVAGEMAIGAASTGGNVLAVGAAANQFTIAANGDTTVGGPLAVDGKLDVNMSVSVHDASGADDGSPLALSRYQRGTGQNDLRVQLGVNLNGGDRLVVGPVYSGDGKFKEQFIVDDLGNVAVGGSLRVLGTNNLLVAYTEEISVQMGPADGPFTWTVNHPGMFASVYTRFAVWHGFSIWGGFATPSAWDSFTGHDQSVDAIAQHVYVRVTDQSSTDYTSGVGYVSESKVGNEHDNSALITVVVLGQGL